LMKPSWGSDFEFLRIFSETKLDYTVFTQTLLHHNIVRFCGLTKYNNENVHLGIDVVFIIDYRQIMNT